MHRRLAFLSLLVASIGCSSSGSTTTVTGKITYDGKPVTTGLINFMVEGGRPLGGGIESDGSYSFDLPPGDYKVRIDSPPPPDPASLEAPPSTPAPAGRPLVGQVPPKFANYETSGLTLTVGADSSQQQDFALTGK